MKRWLIKLSFKSAFHAGSDYAGIGLESTNFIFHSDTIFSGLANQWVKLPKKGWKISLLPSLDEIVSRLNTDTPPFRLSSAFPFKEEDYYLPTPLGLSSRFREDLKDVPYLELDEFLNLINQGKTPEYPFSPDEILLDYLSPRVSLDRVTQTSNIYFSAGVRFRQGGLYFILEINDESLIEPLQTCLGLLAETGLGGERTAGYGQFKWEKEDITNDDRWKKVWAYKQSNKGPSIYYSLSLTCPRQEETKFALAYEIIPRKGWVYSDFGPALKRRTSRMFKEGSLFSQPVKGKVIDVRPRYYQKIHAVYRYGLALTLPLSPKHLLRDVKELCSEN